MNDQVIIAVANAITAQAETLKALIDALPKETKVAIEEKVSKKTVKTEAPAAPVNTVPAAEAPVTVPVAVVAPAPAPVVASTGMPPAPFPTQPVVSAPVTVASIPQGFVQDAAPAVVAPAPVSPSNAPFSDHKALLAYVMDAYKALGPQGMRIQEVLNSLGTKNINDVKPEMYGQLYAGVEALKAGG